jgi:hypothetical protein
MQYDSSIAGCPKTQEGLTVHSHKQFLKIKAARHSREHCNTHA